VRGRGSGFHDFSGHGASVRLGASVEFVGLRRLSSA
jgi:hypothetical protein